MAMPYDEAFRLVAGFEGFCRCPEWQLSFPDDVTTIGITSLSPSLAAVLSDIPGMNIVHVAICLFT